MIAVAILAGGTGGHVMPAEAVAERLRIQGVRLHWFGRRSSMESESAARVQAVYHAIAAGGLRGKSWFRAGVHVLILAYSIARCCLMVWRIRPRPAAAIGFGGYVSLPSAFACLLLRIPLVLHEQNARTGSANRLLSRWASALFCGLPGAFDGNKKAQIVGNPVRKQILCRAKDDRSRNQKAVRLLIFGGSQGASFLNKVAPEMAARLGEGWEILHLCGPSEGEGRATSLRDEYSALGVQADVRTFEKDMAALYGWADLVLCRAGAMTLAELSVFGLPALLVPLPNAIDNHQTANADIWESAGAGDMLPEQGCTPKALVRRLETLRAQLPARATAAKKLSSPNAAQQMAERIVALAGDAA